MQDFEFKTKPYKHQLEQFNKHKDDPAISLFDDMGTGKSKISIDIAAYKYCNDVIDAVLVIAPNNVHKQWIDEQFPTHCSVPYKAFVWSSSKLTVNYYMNGLDDFITPKMNKLKVFAVNVEAFQSESIIRHVARFVKHNNVFIIVDEATRIGTPTAKRSKTIHKLNKYGQRCILTGTPATKGPFKLWSMYEFLQHNFFGCNFFIFQARHGVMMNGINQQTGKRYKTLIDEKTWNIVHNAIKKMKEARGGDLMPDDYEVLSSSYDVTEKNVRFIEKKETFTTYKRLDEIKEMIEPITSFATKAECLDLPEKIYTTVYIEMSKEQRKVYETLKKQLLVEYESKTLTVQNKVALTTRLTQICGGYFPYTEKIEYSTNTGMLISYEKKEAKLIGAKNMKIERMKEELDEVTFPIIIWARFVAELQALYAAFSKGHTCALYYGKTSSDDRQDIIQGFKRGEYEIFLGNQATAAFGLNLQNAMTQWYYSNSFNVEDRLQAEDRSHRIGVKGNCLYRDFVYNNSIDEKIAKAIVKGRDMNEFFKQPLNVLLDDTIE